MTRPLRIGIDARLRHYRRGGTSEYTAHLIAALAALKGDEHFVVVQASGDCQALVPPGTGRMTRVESLTPCHHPRERFLLASELAPLGLDLLHSPDVIPPSFGAARHVITIHDIGFLDYPAHFTAESLAHYAGQIEWAVGRASAVVTSSAYVRDRLMQRFPLMRARVSAIPLAPAAHDATSRADEALVGATLARYGLAPGFVLFVGTIEPRKNLLTLIRAHDALCRRQPAAPPLVLAGSTGWLCDDVLAAVAARPDTVKYLGAVDTDDLIALYRAALVLAMPSIHEGFGLPVVEAMQCGCAVVASTGGALPEVADGAALLVDPLDVEGWVSALSRVIASRALREDLRRRGLARAGNLSWRHTARETLRVYRSACARP